MKIHHLGLVVSDVDEVLLALGLDKSDIKEVVYDVEQKNNLYFLYLAKNNMWLELVEPVESTSSVYNFAKKNGLGLHHLAMASNDLKSVEGKYAKRPGNFVLGRYQLSVNSFGGKIRTLFIAIKGLILEFVSNE